VKKYHNESLNLEQTSSTSNKKSPKPKNHLSINFVDKKDCKSSSSKLNNNKKQSYNYDEFEIYKRKLNHINNQKDKNSYATETSDDLEYKYSSCGDNNDEDDISYRDDFEDDDDDDDFNEDDYEEQGFHEDEDDEELREQLDMHSTILTRDQFIENQLDDPIITAEEVLNEIDSIMAFQVLTYNYYEMMHLK
jgi:hypothetical protein